MLKREIKVYSEIGNLKTVFLHRPGQEIENLTPNFLGPLLFDDIPYLKIAREEHDNFARVLRNNGTEILYLEELATDSIKENEIKDEFIDEVIYESGIRNIHLRKELKAYLNSFTIKDMIDKIIAGVRKKDLDISEKNDEYPFDVSHA